MVPNNLKTNKFNQQTGVLIEHNICLFVTVSKNNGIKKTISSTVDQSRQVNKWRCVFNKTRNVSFKSDLNNDAQTCLITNYFEYMTRPFTNSKLEACNCLGQASTQIRPLYPFGHFFRPVFLQGLHFLPTAIPVWEQSEENKYIQAFLSKRSLAFVIKNN